MNWEKFDESIAMLKEFIQANIEYDKALEATKRDEVQNNKALQISRDADLIKASDKVDSIALAYRKAYRRNIWTIFNYYGFK